MISGSLPARPVHRAALTDPAISHERALLLLRYALVNMTGVALAGAAFHQGWLTRALHADSSGLGVVTTALFGVGMVLSTRLAVVVSRDLDAASGRAPAAGGEVGRHISTAAGLDRGTRSSLEAALRLRLANRIAIVRNIASSLVLLGLIGTVLGFIIALGGVDPNAAGDVGRVATMVAALVDGMGVALYTTLIGSVLNVWLMVNYRMLESGTVRLLASLIERSAVDAHA